VQNGPVKLLDVVALLEDRKQDGLVSGQIGTVVEVYPPDAFEVEFLDSEGRTISLVTLKRSEFLVLRHEPVSQPTRQFQQMAGIGEAPLVPVNRSGSWQHDANS